MEQTNRKVIIIIVVFALVFGGYLIFGKKKAQSPTEAISKSAAFNIDSFAQCLKDKGAVFYGAFWCSHCQNQKKLLENSKNMPYVECSAPDGKGQLPICNDKKIEGYPTWVFADDSRESGELSLETLSQKTGCSL
jgi:hypothetical protein